MIDLDLDVDAGEIVGLLGPNGAGKTTTMRMLTTLLRPSAGTATVAGADLTTDAATVRRRIGYVGQAGGAGPTCRVRDELVLHARLYGRTRDEADARATALLADLDLGGLDRRIVQTLSGGQRRRLDVAMGMVNEPALLFLDEPSAGLDPQSRANLWDHVRAARRNGATVLLTTHYLDEADALCDRILVVDHGRIVAEGTPDALKRQVSGDLILLSVAEPDTARAAEVAGGAPGAHEVVASDGEVRFRVSDGASTTPVLLRALDAHGVDMQKLEIRRPSLDDVFLELTGRSLRDDPPAGGRPVPAAPEPTEGV